MAVTGHSVERTAARARVVLTRPWMIDLPLALLLAGEALVGLPPNTSAPAVILSLVGSLCVVGRRQAPMAVVAATSAAYILTTAVGYVDPRLPFAPLVALYTVAAYRPTAVALRAGGAALVAVIAAALASPHGINDDVLLDYPLALLAALAIGYGMRMGQARAALLEERSAQLARDQAERTAQAVEHERARIARELHDIVAHHVSVMVAQATAAQAVFEQRPQQSQQALGSIAAVGREALVEMRRLLGVIRPRGEELPQEPVPGLDRLPALVQQLEGAGLRVQLAVSGRQRRLPAGVELSAYRIIQEALTNSLKHAGPTRAQVDLGYCDDCLRLRIIDEGPALGIGAVADRASGEGRGLVGMQERAALLAGFVAAGPAPGRGFVVTARLPIVSSPQ
jgi:signal transduction histidine kinase